MQNKRMKSTLYLSLILSCALPSFAEEAVPLILPEEKKTISEQAKDFGQAISPVLRAGADSTVRLWAGSKKLAYGTVVGDGSQVLTKWSEVMRAKVDIQVEDSEGYYIADLVGVYPEEDLALLEIQDKKLTPVIWSLQPVKLGSFIAAPQPDGRLAAFGVVSVLERNLRDTDLAYLGVIGDPEYTGKGLKIASVAEGSGADAAGLKEGQIIYKIGDREISGVLELKNALTGLAPGQSVRMAIDQDGAEKTVDVLLGNRPETPDLFNGRLAQMERMGGAVSQVRDEFSHVLQTDMKPKPVQIGGPVVDLKGQVIGITVARADRTRSFVMPAAAVLDLLKQKPMTLEDAQAMLEQKEAAAKIATMTRNQDLKKKMRGQPRPKAVEEERVRAYLNDTKALLELLDTEFEDLQGNP